MKFQIIDYQVKVAEKINRLLDLYDTVILNAPTGSGKSGIGYLCHYLTRQSNNPHYKSMILNHQKVLMDQYADLFEGIQNVTSIKGKENYDCFKFPEIDVANAPCQFTANCGHKDNCEYFKLRAQMDYAPMLITNYQLVLSLIDINKYKRDSDLAIYDECHNLNNLFTDYRKVIVDTGEAKQYRDLKPYLQRNGADDLLESVEEGIEALTKFNPNDWEPSFEEVFRQKFELVSIFEERYEDPEYLEFLYQRDRHFVNRIMSFVNDQRRELCKWNNYLAHRKDVRFIFNVDESENGEEYSLTPLYVNKMFSGVSKIISDKRLMMSSTVWKPEKQVEELGLEGGFEYIELPNKFPISNRPVLFKPITNVNAQNSKKDTPKFKLICLAIQEICEMHAQKGESGVIFAPSYLLCSNIKEAVTTKLNKLGYDVISNSYASERDSVMRSFTEGKGKKILISPSFTEGVNFTDDVSRFQIIAKAPFAYLGDSYVREKMEIDPVWYETQALTTIIQTAGRSVRHKDDYAITYVLDSNALRVYKNYSNDVPQWFRESVTIL